MAECNDMGSVLHPLSSIETVPEDFSVNEMSRSEINDPTNINE